MFMMMIMLAVSSTIVEMMFAANFPAWRHYAHKYKWFNMTVSVFISFILGVAFGAGGLIALGAAMVSTVLSIPGYAYLYLNYDSAAARAVGGNLFKHHWDKWKVALVDLSKVIYKIIRFITAPIWMSRIVVEKFRIFSAKYKAFKAARI